MARRTGPALLGPLGSIVAVAGAFSACGTTRGAGEKIGHAAGAVVVCSGGDTVQGIDVSEYQGSVDWGTVAASGLGFAIARVSDGTGHMDATFARNWAGIKAAGMVRGAYQFFRAGADPVAQAEIVVTAVGTLGPEDLPPIADVEVMDGQSGGTLVANLATWVGVIESELGATPILYSAPGFWDALPSTGQFASETLWVANWQVSCPDTPHPWAGWKLWQYADNGTVPGIGVLVDLDEFNGTRVELGPSAGDDAPSDAGAPPPAGDAESYSVDARLTEPFDDAPSGGEAASGQGWALRSSAHEGCSIAAPGTGDPPFTLVFTATLAWVSFGRSRPPARVRRARSPPPAAPSARSPPVSSQ